MTQTETILSKLPGDVLTGLRRVDRLYSDLKNDKLPIPSVIKENSEVLEIVDWDVVICGGTLGILIGAALVQRGWRVALLERGILKGREQEWNISRQELDVFLELGLLSEEELERAIASEYNPACVRFLDGTDIWINDVLNIGIDPIYLLETLKAKFLELGGTLQENTPFSDAVIHPNGVVINSSFRTRLLIDAMGHFSPIVQQARQGEKPEGICLVVGTCAQGYPENTTGDLIASFTPIQHQCQYFWEAFPAKDGRTTYLFTYLDANPERFSLEFLFEEYLRLLPEYQSIELSQLTFKRALFGFFPSYQSSLKMPWNRILPVGDSSGSQSPVSFGGFGAMVRHLERLTKGIDEALKDNLLNQNDLALLKPYQPNISVTWLFQRAMSVGVNQRLSSNQINQLLSGVFQVMKQLGDEVLRPFLQDVVQFTPLTTTLVLTALTKPMLVFSVIPQVGFEILFKWIIHYIYLGIYRILFSVSQGLLPVADKLPSVYRYYYHRWFEAFKYGSGRDY